MCHSRESNCEILQYSSTELAVWKSNQACWSNTIVIPSQTHDLAMMQRQNSNHLLTHSISNLFLHDLVYKLLNWHQPTFIHSLVHLFSSVRGMGRSDLQVNCLNVSLKGMGWSDLQANCLKVSLKGMGRSDLQVNCLKVSLKGMGRSDLQVNCLKVFCKTCFVGKLESLRIPIITPDAVLQNFGKMNNGYF